MCSEFVQISIIIPCRSKRLLDFSRMCQNLFKKMLKNIELKTTRISESEFKRICRGIYEDREIICKHNPLGSHEEILLWMLLSVLVSYLNLSEIETPCFNGKPTAETYRDAILFVLEDRKKIDFDAKKYLAELVKE